MVERCGEAEQEKKEERKSKQGSPNIGAPKQAPMGASLSNLSPTPNNANDSLKGLIHSID